MIRRFTRSHALALSILLSLATGFELRGQDGGQLYGLYCGACHGADGKGDPAGQFPPLSGSPWVAGDPDRAIKVVLFGIQGPLEVNGKEYNLVMPPQGAALPDDQIAAILSFVRTSLGNNAGSVDASTVTRIRQDLADRTEPWTAKELLNLHPLPLNQTPLKNLISFSKLSNLKNINKIKDFTAAGADNVEEEHDGLINLDNVPADENFIMVWEGIFEAPETGIYEFLVDADDAANLQIGKKILIRLKGKGPMEGTRTVSRTMKLSKGEHPIRVEYLQLKDDKGIAIGWRNSREKPYSWLTESISTSPNPRPPIPVDPELNRPVIYRNFIEGTTARAIGVGFPGGVNLAYSADHLAPELIWTGAFINGAYKWQNRGMEPSPPFGKNIVKLTNKRALPETARFRGYSLDQAGNPKFRATLGNQKFSESWQPAPTSQGQGLVRSLELSGDGSPLELPISEGLTVTPSSEGTWQIGDNLTVKIQGGVLILKNGNSSLILQPGQPVTITYVWN